jgi:Domain of Unknown Function (DUF928)
MVFQKWVPSMSAIATLLSPALFGFTSLPSQLSGPQTAPWLVSVNFPASPGGNGPARTASGGSRSTCYVEGLGDGVTPMTVLMPSNNVGTTVEADPDLFLYVPKTNVDGGEVVIIDSAADREVYVKQFDLSNKPGDTPGIVKLNLEGANLQPGKTYSWTFTPFCTSTEGDIEYIQTFVEGHFQRTTLTSDQDVKLKQADTPLEKAEIYAQARIWNETLELTEQLRPSEPEEWTNLLTSVGLEELVEVPYFGEAPLMAEHKSGAEAVLLNPAEPEQKNNSSAPIEGLW